MKLSLKPIRASRAPGFQGHYGGSQLVLTLYRMQFFCFHMYNRLPEMMKNGDGGIFPVYYSLKASVFKHAAVIQVIHAQPRVEPNLHNTLLRVKRFGSEIPGQVYDYRTSQEGAVPRQELDRWREGTLDGPSGKCTRNLSHW